jgi:hypothetical protein
MTDASATQTHARPPFHRGPSQRPWPIPHINYLRTFVMPDGRPICVDKRGLLFVTVRNRTRSSA